MSTAKNPYLPVGRVSGETAKNIAATISGGYSFFGGVIAGQFFCALLGVGG